MSRQLILASWLAGCASAAPPWAKPAGAPHAGTDCHMHVHPNGEVPYTAERVLGALEGAGLQRACMLSQGYQRPSCDAADCGPQRPFTEGRNDWTIEQARQSPHLLPFCSVPLREPWAVEEVQRCLGRGARGLKLHPASEGVSLTDPGIAAALDAIAAKVAAAQVPLLIHVRFQEAAEVRALFELARRAPTTTFIAAHLLGQNMKLLTEAPPNVFVETSGLVMAPKQAMPAFVAVWRAVGLERVLLGSDWPLFHPSDHLARLRDMGLTDDELDQLVRKNAERLFVRPAPGATP